MKVGGERIKINIVTMSLDLCTFALLVHPLISASQFDSIVSSQSRVFAKLKVALFEHLLEIAWQQVCEVLFKAMDTMSDKIKSIIGTGTFVTFHYRTSDRDWFFFDEPANAVGSILTEHALDCSRHSDKSTVIESPTGYKTTILNFSQYMW